MPDNQNVSIWDNPMYAWQQQLASGANLAKNLNWQTLLGLTLGTGLGRWLGHKFYNWNEMRKEDYKNPPNPPEVNSAAINSAIRDYLLPQGEFDLGWKPQYQLPTANKLFTDAVTPKPSSFDWRQNNRQQQPFFQMTPTPQAPATPTRPTTPSTTVNNPWGNSPYSVGQQLGQRYF